MLALVIGAFDGLALIVELFDIIAVRRFHHPFDRLTALCFLVLEQYAIFDSIMIAVGYIIRFNGTAFFLSASCFKKPLAGGTKHLILGHLSGENNTPLLARRVSEAAMLREDIRPGEDVQLQVALRDETGDIFVLKETEQEI